VQGIVLAAFLVLFFRLIPPKPSTSQLDVEPVFQWAPAFLLCLIDPVASLAAFAASRAVSILILVPAAVLVSALVFPRVFCSHVCPVGALLDVVGIASRRRSGPPMPKLRFIKYSLLASAVLCAVFGLGLAGLVTPMPLLVRGLRAGADVLDGTSRASSVWLVVLGVILLLSLVRKRFWCNVLCPSGALLSLVSRFSLFKRVKTDACVRCGRCVDVCDFDAIRTDDFTTTADCAYCGACRAVCPADAIVYRTSFEPLPVRPGRRDFLVGACSAAGLLAGAVPFALGDTPTRLRPPGALPGDAFLSRCIRCGLCADACPGPAIQLAGIAGGLDDYGTPHIDPLVAGCSPDCNNCGRVCPTGAIQHHPLEVKNRIIIGTARYRKGVCRPWRGDDTCPRYCEIVCREAGMSATIDASFRSHAASCVASHRHA